MTYETKLSNIIIRLKEYRAAHPEYTLQRIADHTGISLSTVTRIFADGSENQSFRYESIRPIAKMLLGLDDLDEGNDDEKALKAIIQFKDSAIEELRRQIEEQKEHFDRKLEKERSQYRTSLDFLKHQIELKDARIDRLFDALKNRRALFEELQARYNDAIDMFKES